MVIGHVVDLVGPQQGVIQTCHEVWDTVGGIEALIGVDFPRTVHVSRHLPPAQVDGFEARSDLLHGLAAGDGAEGRDVGLGVEQLPKPRRSPSREAMLDPDGSR
jgi:hypothetical protein